MAHDMALKTLVLDLRESGHRPTEIPDLVAERGYGLTVRQVNRILAYERSRGDRRARVRTNAVYA